MAPPSLKKLIVLGACLAGLNATQLFGALLVEETFDYAVGQSISGKSGGSGFTGNWVFGRDNTNNGTGTITMAENGVVINGERAVWATRNVLIEAADTPTIYFAYNLTPIASAVTGSSFTDALIFKAANPAGSGRVDAFRTGINYSNAGPALKANAGGSDPTILTAGKTSLGTTYTIVGRFTFNDGNGNATLMVWINPENEDSPAVFTKSWASSITTINQIVIQRYDDNVRGAGSTSGMDDIRIATDWHSALGIPAPIPEPSSVAVLTGAAGLAFASSRRRR